MRITKIKILDFYGLTAFETDNLGRLNLIVGNNGAGKSSVLLAIKGAFKSFGVDPYVIKSGAKKAEILIEIDRRVLVERQITPSANNVQVTVDGHIMSKPQAWLNNLLGKGSNNFNPVDFFSPKPPKGITPDRYRRELLLSAMPFTVTAEMLQKILWPDGDPNMSGYIDWDTIDFKEHGLVVLAKIQKVVYDRRHDVGLDVTRQKGSIEQDRTDLPPTMDADRFKGFDLNKKVDELSQAKLIIGQQQSDVLSLTRLRERDVSITNEIEHHKQEILRLEAEQRELRETGVKLKEKTEAYVRPDIAPLEQDIADHQIHQKLIHRLEDIERRQGELEATSAQHKALDTLHKVLMAEVPRRILADMKLPIEGLVFDGDEILINGVALDKLSDSEKIGLALQIARALSGDLKVVCIDGFEKVDGAARKLFEKATEGDGFEYFLTVVNQDPDDPGELRLEVVDEDASSSPAKPTKAGGAGF